MDKQTKDRDYAMRETAKHIRRVQELLAETTTELLDRAIRHDTSKWSEAEWPYFAENTSKLKETTYGSERYKQLLEDIKPALDHHYSVNSHHPEFYGDGMWGMSLLDLIEMLSDWKAATERHSDGNLMRSIEINAKRFNMPEYLQRCLINTARELGWD